MRKKDLRRRTINIPPINLTLRALYIGVLRVALMPKPAAALSPPPPHPLHPLYIPRLRIWRISSRNGREGETEFPDIRSTERGINKIVPTGSPFPFLFFHLFLLRLRGEVTVEYKSIYIPPGPHIGGLHIFPHHIITFPPPFSVRSPSLPPPPP